MSGWGEHLPWPEHVAVTNEFNDIVDGQCPGGCEDVPKKGGRALGDFLWKQWVDDNVEPEDNDGDEED